MKSTWIGTRVSAPVNMTFRFSAHWLLAVSVLVTQLPLASVPTLIRSGPLALCSFCSTSA